MIEETKKIFEAVSEVENNISKKYFKKSNGNPYASILDKIPVISVEVSYVQMLIKISIWVNDDLIDMILYSSEIEDRIWIEKNNDYESWDNYLKRKITQIKKELKNTIL